MNNQRLLIISFVVLAGIYSLVSAADAPVPPKIALKAEPFALTQVRLLDGPFKHAQELDHQYLLSLDPDRLLHTVRINAGIPSWGSDGGRVFDILVDGRKIATQRLDGKHLEDFFGEVYRIPADLTQGKAQITVRFQAQPGEVFGCWLIKSE